MSSNKRRLFCLLWLALSSGSWGDSVHYLYTNDRQGEVGPCECSGPQVGGLERLANAVASEKKSKRPVVLVDSGDLFFSLPVLPVSEHKAAASNAETIAISYATLGYSFLTPGDRDLALGLDTYRKLVQRTQAKALSANLADAQGKLLFEPHAVYSAGSRKIGVIGISGAEAFAQVVGVKVLDPVLAVKRSVAKLKAGGVERILLLSHSGLDEDRKLSQIPGVDSVVGAHSLDALRSAEKVGTTRIVQTMPRGQELGILSEDGTEDRLVLLDASWKGSNAVSRLISTANRAKTKSAIAEKSAAAKRPKDAYVANAFVCKTCHSEQHAFWEKTKHASAYLVLYAKDQPYDPDCIGCHTLGYQDRRGFKARAGSVVLGDSFKDAQGPFVETMMKSIFATDPGKGPLDSRKEPDRYAKLKAKYHSSIAELQEKRNLSKLYLGVQCEHCHGNRAGHPTQKVAKSKIDPALCKNCHDSTHHPAFNFAAMRPRIACPKIKR